MSATATPSPPPFSVGQLQTLPVSQPINGVGVLRYPAGHTPMPDGTVQENRVIACSIADCVQQGSVIVLPSDCDEYGRYLWDFRIEGAPFDDVELERVELAIDPDDDPRG